MKMMALAMVLILGACLAIEAYAADLKLATTMEAQQMKTVEKNALVGVSYNLLLAEPGVPGFYNSNRNDALMYHAYPNWPHEDEPHPAPLIFY